MNLTPPFVLEYYSPFCTREGVGGCEPGQVRGARCEVRKIHPRSPSSTSQTSSPSQTSSTSPEPPLNATNGHCQEISSITTLSLLTTHYPAQLPTQPMKNIPTLLIFAMLLSACTAMKDPEPKEEILVSVAASLKESMEALGAEYEKQTGTHVLFNFAGSNDLARQIIATPKVDIFLSAAENWMDTVEKAGRLVPGTRRNILSNSLVVIGGAGGRFSMSSPCDLASLPYKNLALADPAAVPAGKYAKTWLSGIQCGGDTLWSKVKRRVVPAPDVRAALGLVMADPELVGIVYKTDHMQFPTKTKLLYEVSDGPPIRYVIALVAEGSAPTAARKFHEFLLGARAQEVFQRHGFTPLPGTR